MRICGVSRRPYLVVAWATVDAASVAVTHSFHHLCVVTSLLTLVVFIIPNMRSNESIDRCCVPIYVLLLRRYKEEPYTPKVGIS